MRHQQRGFDDQPGHKGFAGSCYERGRWIAKTRWRFVGHPEIEYLLQAADLDLRIARDPATTAITG